MENTIEGIMNSESQNVKVERKIEINKIAWQSFLRNTGFRFRRELTIEERKSITEVPEYQYYIEEAEKIYKKKQSALLNKKYPMIDVPATGNSGMAGGAYTLCFVYSKYNGNFVLSGYMKEVEEYLKKNYTHYFCNFSLWNLGANRDIWKFWKENIGIFEPNRRSKTYKGKEKWKFNVRTYSFMSGEDFKVSLWFKRLPKRWIPEFDEL